MLCDAIGQAAAAVQLSVADGTGTGIALTFGAPQGTDVRPVVRDDLTGTGQPLNHQAVANYIAKYATKTLTVPSLPAQGLRHQVDIEHLRCSAHHKRMITAAPSATRTANATRGDGRWTRPSSWSSTPGPIPEPATPPLLALNSRSFPLLTRVSTRAKLTSPRYCPPSRQKEESLS